METKRNDKGDELYTEQLMDDMKWVDEHRDKLNDDTLEDIKDMGRYYQKQQFCGMTDKTTAWLITAAYTDGYYQALKKYKKDRWHNFKTRLKSIFTSTTEDETL